MYHTIQYGEKNETGKEEHAASPPFARLFLPSRFLSPANQPAALSPPAVEVLPVAPGVPVAGRAVQQAVSSAGGRLVAAHQRIAPVARRVDER